MKSIPFIILLLCLLIPFQLKAQVDKNEIRVDSTQTVKISLTDGSDLFGKILSIRDDEIEVQQEVGRLFLNMDKIKSIHGVDMADPSAMWFTNPNKTRLLISPTARPLGKDHGYYQNIYVFLSGFSYGITDNISLTGGFSMVPGIGLSNQGFIFAGKAGAEVFENKYIAAGAGFIMAGGSSNVARFGFTNFTAGSDRGSLTTGLIGAHIAGEPVSAGLLFGGDYRLTQRIAFVSENYFFTGSNETILSYGLRFMGEHMSFDLAFFRDGVFSDLGIGIPYIDFVFTF